MKFVLDTSAYSAFDRGDARLRQWINADNDIVVPMIVLGELRAGFAAGSRQAQNEQFLQRVLDAPNVSLATLTDDTTKHFAATYLMLRQAGTPIGTNDMWIAALALELKLSLLTTDMDFARISTLPLVKI